MSARRLLPLLGLSALVAAPALGGDPPTVEAAEKQATGKQAVGARSEAARPVETPWVFDLSDAQGPPELDCETAKAEAEAAKAARDSIEIPDAGVPDAGPPTRDGGVARKPRKPKQPKAPDPVTSVVVDRRKVKLTELPGGVPDEVPVQPLEGPPVARQRIARVLQAAAQGKPVRISVWGASHTGADFFTGTLRRLLQHRHGDRGHGFILPGALYRGYRGNDVNLCRTDAWRPDWVGHRKGRDDGLYGFAGASVSSGDPLDFGWIETTREAELGRQVSWFDVFLLGQPEGGTAVLQVDATAPVRISTTSATPRTIHVRLKVPTGAHRLMIRPAGDGEIRVLGVSPEREGAGVMVDAMGIRGRTAKTWLSWAPRLFKEGISALRPDLIVLAYGTNEANLRRYTDEAYTRDLRKVLAMARKAAPRAACLLVGPTDRGKRKGRHRYFTWARTAPVAEVQRAVSAEFGCAFWDWQKAMGGEGSMVAWRLQKKPLAARDLIHLTIRGYIWSAERLLAAMDAEVEALEVDPSTSAVGQ